MIQLALTAFSATSFLTKAIIIGGLALSLLTAGGVMYHHIWSNGYDRALTDIAKQDAAAIARATTYRNAFRDCRDRGLRWDQGTGKCGGG